MSNLIVCLRHGEKPANAEEKDVPVDEQGPGLEEGGTKNRKSLTIRGWQRAGALAATYLCGHVAPFAVTEPVQILVPKYVDSSTNVDETTSHRPYQTVLALAHRMGALPTALYGRDDANDLYSHVEDFEGTAVVCWQHDALVDLAKLLAGDSAPTKWPHGRFDVNWLFQRGTSNQAYRWEQLDQDVLA